MFFFLIFENIVADIVQKCKPNLWAVLVYSDVFDVSESKDELIILKGINLQDFVTIKEMSVWRYWGKKL